MEEDPAQSLPRPSDFDVLSLEDIAALHSLIMEYIALEETIRDDDSAPGASSSPDQPPPSNTVTWGTFRSVVRQAPNSILSYLASQSESFDSAAPIHLDDFAMVFFGVSDFTKRRLDQADTPLTTTAGGIDALSSSSSIRRSLSSARRNRSFSKMAMSQRNPAAAAAAVWCAPSAILEFLSFLSADAARGIGAAPNDCGPALNHISPSGTRRVMRPGSLPLWQRPQRKLSSVGLIGGSPASDELKKPPHDDEESMLLLEGIDMDRSSLRLSRLDINERAEESTSSKRRRHPLADRKLFFNGSEGGAADDPTDHPLRNCTASFPEKSTAPSSRGTNERRSRGRRTVTGPVTSLACYQASAQGGEHWKADTVLRVKAHRAAAAIRRRAVVSDRGSSLPLLLTTAATVEAELTQYLTMKESNRASTPASPPSSTTIPQLGRPIHCTNHSAEATFRRAPPLSTGEYHHRTPSPKRLTNVPGPLPVQEGCLSFQRSASNGLRHPAAAPYVTPLVLSPYRRALSSGAAFNAADALADSAQMSQWLR